MKLSQLLPGDCPVFYHTYLDTLKPGVELLEYLENQQTNFPAFLTSIPEDKMGYRYAADKWTVAEVLVHITDAERVFQYRALRFGRKDETPLPGFDQDPWVVHSKASSWDKARILEEYRVVRESTLSLFRQFTEDDLRWKGTASGYPVSLGAVGFIICGHQRHHRNILRARYLDR